MSHTPSLVELEQTDAFIRRHIGPDAAEQQAMLSTLGADTLEALVAQTVPQSILRDDLLPLDGPRSEAEVLDYLKQVIIDDSLGLASELEAQMQHVVDQYECEWANALNDPEKLKRFRTFVNDRRADPDVHFVREREQRRPAAPLHLIPTVEEAV